LVEILEVFSMPFSPLPVLRCFAFLSFSSLLSVPAFAAPLLPADVTAGPSIEGVAEYRLGNGLRILLAPDDSKPTTTVNMTYLVGSRFENYGQTGMAHLLEHMMFKGTATMRNAMGEFSRRGLRANGSTSSDRTNYFASFAANPETLKWYLGWQADAMVNSTILRQDLDSEMTVVRNEMESGENSPFRILMQKMQAAAFQWHAYGKATIGARSDVENVDVGQLKAFYREYYQPDNAVLIVAGKFDPDTALADIAASLGKLPKPTRALPPHYTVEPAQDGERTITLRRTGGSALVAAMYHIPSGASPDFIPFDLANTILADTPSRRIYHALVPAGLAAAVFGFTMNQYDPGITLFGAQLQNAMKPDAAMQALTDTLETVDTHPFTQVELDRARTKWLTQWDQLYSDPEQVGAALSEAVASGDWRLFFLNRDRARTAKLADVQRVAVAYLMRSNRTEGRYVPTQDPTRAPALDHVDPAAALLHYKGDVSVKTVDAFDPTPAAIDAHTQRGTLSLANGPVDFALLPKPTRGGRVQARIDVDAGSATTLSGRRATAIAATSLLDRGTPKWNRQAIQDRFDSLSADVGFSGGARGLTISMSTTGANLPALTEFVLELVRDATYPQEELVEYQRQMDTALHRAMSEPNAVAYRALSRLSNPWPRDDVRYVPTVDEEFGAIDSLKRDDLMAYHDTFIGSGHIAVAAVGDFKSEDFKAAMSNGLASWKRALTYERLSDPYVPVPAQRFVIEMPDKANAFYVSAMPLEMQDTNPDFPALYLANFLFGSSETSRLWNRVREKEGLSYSVRSGLNASSFEPSGSWIISAIYAPQNRERLEKAIGEEMQRLVKDGFTDQEIKDGITSVLNYRALLRAQDPVITTIWSDYLQSKRTFKWSMDFDEKIKALTPQTVNAALRKYMKPQDFSTALAGTFTVKAK
jgi:zinc protease